MSGRAAILVSLLVAFVGTWVSAQAASGAADESSSGVIPHYDHIFVIIAENKSFSHIMDNPDVTPNLHRLANEYGLATQFYAEVHSSEGNYVAIVGGDTFGIHDDDAFYCKPGLADEFCPGSRANGYVEHSIREPSLPDQLAAHGLSWKGYFEDMPAPGSLMPRWPTNTYPVKGQPNSLYAAKHNGFVNFATVHDAPYAERKEHFVNFQQLDADLASGRVPNYAHIVPNQCNDMHGLGRGDGADVPEDCHGGDAIIRQGDAEIGMLVDKITRSKIWSDKGNVAIVVTFDENDKAGRSGESQGCCGYDPHSPANFGGGRIPTIVITNHGPRHVTDATPYNHYSLLRTTEAAFGIKTYLGHAADSDKGVVAMAPLFSVQEQKN